MEKDKTASASSTGNTVGSILGTRNPLGCTFALIDLVGVYLVVTHLGEIATRLIGLLRLIP